MSTALLTVPIIGVLSWLTLVALGVWRYHGAIHDRRQHAEKSRSRVLKDAETLDATLIEQLLDAVRPDDLLRNYLKDRAGLVSGLAMENPAAWQNDDLNDLVAQRFHEEVQHERRRFWVFVVVSLAGSVAAIFIIGAVLYHFHRDDDTTTNPSLHGSAPTFSVPTTAPQPDAELAPPFAPLPANTPSSWPFPGISIPPITPDGENAKPDDRDAPRDPSSNPPISPERKTHSRPFPRPHELPA